MALSKGDAVNTFPMLMFPKAGRLNSVLGLALDGSRLQAVVVRRANGSLKFERHCSVALSLDLLTNEPQLVGREIRNHLDKAGIRERNCVVGLPLKWALTTHVALPDLPEADVASFLQIEAERSFPCDVSTLHVATSQCRIPPGKSHALMVGIPTAHLALVEQVMRVAKLKPVSFSLGLTAMQPTVSSSEPGVLALSIGETSIGLMVTAGGGVAALRVLEGALELEGSRRILQAESIAREVRITLGQLPLELRQTVGSIRVFGPRDLAHQLADELDLRLESLGLKAEAVTPYANSELVSPLPPDSAVESALALAAQKLGGKPTTFEFLPPRLTTWQRVNARYASGRMRTVLSAGAAVAILVGGLFFYQQCQLWRLQAQWSQIAPTVTQLEATSKKINQYRPWYDETVRGLTLLRCLADAFPEDGSVTAKTVEIRDLKTVMCTGTARNYQALLLTVQKLRAQPQIRDANLGPTRGQTPALQFSFSFAWNEGAANAN